MFYVVPGATDQTIYFVLRDSGNFLAKTGLLYNSAGRICTRDQVIETVWPDAVGEGVSEQAIDALVRRLRDRLAEIDPDWQYIITVRGHGFRLNNPETE